MGEPRLARVTRPRRSTPPGSPPSGRANRPWHKHTPPAEPSLWPRVSPTESQSLGRLWQSVPHDTRALRGTSRAHWLDGISKMDGKNFK